MCLERPLRCHSFRHRPLPTRYNGQDVGYVQYHTPVPRILQWNMSVQRAFATNYVVEVAYVASHGSNLNFATDLNQVPQQYLSPNDSPQFRPYPNFESIPGSTNNAISNYNSLQASITKRMTNGLSLSFNYVWSHMLDDMDSSGWGSRAGPQDYQIANNPARELQQLQLRRPQRLQGLRGLSASLRQGQKVTEQQLAAR